MSYDERCWDLAKLFLEDGPRCLDSDIDVLAQAIQDVCEDHCRDIEEQEAEKRAEAIAEEMQRAKDREHRLSLDF